MMDSPCITSASAYRELYGALKREGVFDRALAWYARRILINFILLAISILLLMNAHHTSMLCVAAVLLGFAMVQIGFIGHDAQHGQVVRNPKARLCFGLVHWNLLTGLSHSWWQDKHVRHHLHTNIQGMDPDMYPALTFSRREALGKRGFARMIARDQVWWYVPLLGSVAAYFRLLSIVHLLRQRPSGFVPELGLIALHHVLLLGVVFHFLTPLDALQFIALNYLATGLYMGAVFSTNHLAMPPASPTAPAQRMVSQLSATRNIETGRLGDFLFGGLNYQIEHHLFPSLPRPHLRAASRQIRAFCMRHELPYQSCNALAAYREIAQELHSVGAPLRANPDSAC